MTVWDGRELLLWGGVTDVPATPPTAAGGGYPPGYPGYTGTPALDGYSYNPKQHRWASIPTAPVPFLGFEVSSVWTGHDLLVWGYDEHRNRAAGALYDPGRRRWTPMADQSMVVTGGGVWTGREWIVIGLDRSAVHVRAAAFQPVTNTWRSLPDPPSRNGPHQGEVVVWTGQTVVFAIPLGEARALAFNPTSNKWTELAASPAGPLTESNVAWTGDDVLLTGGSQVPIGSDLGHPVVATAAYNPSTNTWNTAAPPPHPVSHGIPVDHRASSLLQPPSQPSPTTQSPAPGVPSPPHPAKPPSGPAKTSGLSAETRQLLNQ